MVSLKMVIVDSLPDEEKVFITLRPNRSLSWRGNVALVCSLGLLAVLIGGGFALLGAWVILPFSGLEIMLLLTCLYILSERNAHQEVITFSPDKVIIERGKAAPKKAWTYSRRWSSFYVEKPDAQWTAPTIYIRNRADKLELGAFLNRRDKIKLVNTLKRIVNNHLPPHQPGQNS